MDGWMDGWNKYLYAAFVYTVWYRDIERND